MQRAFLERVDALRGERERLRHALDDDGGGRSWHGSQASGCPGKPHDFNDFRASIVNARPDPRRRHLDSHRDRHRIRRPDRLRVRHPFRRARLHRDRPRERHARALLRRRGVDPPDVRGARRAAARTSSSTRRSTSATPTASSGIFAKHAGSIELIVHTAAQPSHDWAAKEPQTDFTVNANGTLNLLEAARKHALDAPFVFCSTNKVYGDTPNRLPLEEHEERLELPARPRVLRRHPDLDVDRQLDALAVRRLQGRRRPARAGVRALLRHADRVRSAAAA